MDTLLSNRPSTYSELIKRSIKIYKLAFLKVIPFSLLFSIIAFIPRLISDLRGRDIYLDVSTLNLNQLWILLLNLFLIVILLGILWHVHCVIRKKHEPFLEDVKIALRKVLQVFIAAIIITVLILALNIIVYGIQVYLNRFHLLFAPNIWGLLATTVIFLIQLILLFYFSVLFVFVVPIITIENQSILSAIDRSISLVWNHWWRVVSVQFTPWICYLILLMIVRSLGIGAHIFFTKETEHSVWVTILNIILFALLIPWVASTLLVQLHDLELRNKLAPPKEPKKRKARK